MHLPNMDCSSTAPSWHVMYYVPRNALLLLGLHMSLYWETAYDGAGVRERFLDTYLRSRCMTLTLGLHSTIQLLGWDLCSRCYKVTLSRGEYIHTERCWGQSHPPSSSRLLKESSSWQLFRVCEWDFTHHLQHFPCKRPILWYNKTQWDSGIPSQQLRTIWGILFPSAHGSDLGGLPIKCLVPFNRIKMSCWAQITNDIQ